MVTGLINFMIGISDKGDVVNYKKSRIIKEAVFSFSPAIVVSNDVMAQDAVRLSQGDSLLDTRGFLRKSIVILSDIYRYMW